MIYRALADLGIGKKIVKSGEIFPGGWLKPHAIPILEADEKISPANLPPLAALPRWKSSSTKLAKAEIVTADQFLEADDAQIAKVLNMPIAEVAQAKRDLFAQFGPPPRSR